MEATAMRLQSDSGTIIPPVFSSPSVRADVIQDYKGVKGLKPSWDELAMKAEANHPYVSHAWISTWMECFGKGKSPYIVLATEGNKPKGIAPLMLSQERLNGILVRRLGTFYNSHTGRCDFLVDANENGANYYRAIWDRLLRDQREWDVLELAHVPVTSSAFQEINKLAQESGLHTGTWGTCDSPYITAGDWGRYYEELPRKHKSNLRNRYKRLGQLGKIDFEEISSGEAIERSLTDGFQLEAAAWKGESGTAIVSQPAIRQFYTRLAHRAAMEGWLRLHFLTLNQRRIAFAYCFQYGGGYYLHKLGYDPAYHSYSPANLLCLHLIRTAFSRGVEVFDFIGENEEWKQRWTTQNRPHRWLYVFSPSLAAKVLHAVKFLAIPWLKKATFQFNTSFRKKQT